jgi:hypothetical protein
VEARGWKSEQKVMVPNYLPAPVLNVSLIEEMLVGGG